MKPSLSAVFVVFFALANIMGSVRYIFRWGDPNSSPSYSNYTIPPPEYYMVWNALTFAMLLIALSQLRSFSTKVLSAYLIMLFFVIVSYLQIESFHAQGAARSLVLNGLFFVIFLSNNTWLDITHFNKSIEFMALFGIAYVSFQIYQFLIFGVLPAHSHEGYILRFGSYYDDSLVWGLLLPMFAGYFFQKYRSMFSHLSIGVIFNLLAFLTGSFTAIGTAVFYTVWTYFSKPNLLLFYLTMVVVGLIFYIDDIQKMVIFKAESIDLHLSGFEKILHLDPLSIIGFRPLDTFSESGLLLLLMNFGLPILLLVLTVHILTLRSITHLVNCSSVRPFFGATQGLTFSVLLFSLNLPAIIISPVYLWVAIFSAITISRTTQYTHAQNLDPSTQRN